MRTIWEFFRTCVSRMWPGIRYGAVRILWLYFVFLCFSGLFLIGYGTLSASTGEQWKLVEDIAPFASTLLTLIGTFFTVVSVYFYSPNPRPPTWQTLWIVAPVILLGIGVALKYLLQYRSLPQSLVSGFALLAIGAGLLRLLPYTEP